MSRFAIRRWVAAVLTIGICAEAQALTVAELQRLLQAAPREPVPFVEVRESPWLTAPVETRGILLLKAGVLEKRVDAPRRETWRMLADRIEWEGAGGGSKQILFSQSPALAILADTLRQVVAGDLAALERDFRIELRGDRGAWSLQLTPRGGVAARHLDHLQIEGANAELNVITVVEPQGERTTTRLQR